MGTNGVHLGGVSTVLVIVPPVTHSKHYPSYIQFFFTLLTTYFVRYDCIHTPPAHIDMHSPHGASSLALLCYSSFVWSTLYSSCIPMRLDHRQSIKLFIYPPYVFLNCLRFFSWDAPAFVPNPIYNYIKLCHISICISLFIYQ